jgi:hypothetical protein
LPRNAKIFNGSLYVPELAFFGCAFCSHILGYIKLKGHCNGIKRAFKHLNLELNKLYTQLLIRACAPTSMEKEKHGRTQNVRIYVKGWLVACSRPHTAYISDPQQAAVTRQFYAFSDVGHG